MQPNLHTMKKIKYSLTISDDTDRNNPDQKPTIHELTNLDSLPRFEVGDWFDDFFFNPTCDLGWRAIVTDARYLFSGDRENPEIELALHIREETVIEQSERRSKSGKSK